MLIANGYSWFNFYPIHDNVSHVLGDGSTRYIKLGRFLTNTYLGIRGHGSLPLVTGLLSVLFLGVSSCIVTVFLQQKTRIELVLTGAFLSANLFMVEINTGQQYFRDLFLCALMFGCLGAYCLWHRQDTKHFLLSITLFVIAFGLYPAFIIFVCCLFVALGYIKEVDGVLV